MGWVGRIMAIVTLPLLLAFVAAIGQSSATDAIEQIQTLLVIAGLLWVSQAMSLVTSWRIYRGAVDRRVVDITAQNRPVHERALPMHSGLLQLGFRRLGETDTPLPGRRESLTWVYINGDASITAELVAINVIAVQFNTVFADQAVLETSFPIGENMQRENYRSVKGDGGISATLDQHIEVAREMVLEHGRPIALDTMATYLAWDVQYRQIHIKNSKLGASYRRRLYATLLAGYSVAWLVLFWLVIQAQDEMSVEGLVVMGFLCVPPMAMAVLS